MAFWLRWEGKKEGEREGGREEELTRAYTKLASYKKLTEEAAKEKKVQLQKVEEEKRVQLQKKEIQEVISNAIRANNAAQQEEWDRRNWALVDEGIKKGKDSCLIMRSILLVNHKDTIIWQTIYIVHK